MRGLCVAAGVLAVVVVAGVIAVRAGRIETDSAPRPIPPLDQAGSVPAASAVDDVPTGSVVDITAARQAAVNAVGSTDEVVGAGFISRRALIESMATPSYGPTLADETSAAVTAMMLELGQRKLDSTAMTMSEQPITATAELDGGGAVRVKVWSVIVVATPGAGPGRQVWRTVTLKMVRDGGRWLVDGWFSTPGPTPAPAAEVAFDDAAAFTGPLGWPPAAVTAASVAVVG